MPHYRITHPDATAVSLGGTEYRVREGLIFIPERDRAAIDATRHIGLVPADEKKPVTR